MNGQAPLVVFDMDGVLVRERSSWRVIHDALGTSNEDSFLSYIKGEIDDLEFMRRDIKRWTLADPGLNRMAIERILEGATIMKGFPSAVGEIRKMGFRIVIISGGIDLLANRLAAESGMDGAFANGVEFDTVGNLTGEGILKVPLRDKGSVFDTKDFKSRFKGPIISIGDSEVDLTMFKRSHLSIAFRPDNDRVSNGADIAVEGADLSVLPGIIRDEMVSLHNNLLS